MAVVPADGVVYSTPEPVEVRICPAVPTLPLAVRVPVRTALERVLLVRVSVDEVVTTFTPSTDNLPAEARARVVSVA